MVLLSITQIERSFKMAINTTEIKNVQDLKANISLVAEKLYKAQQVLEEMECDLEDIEEEEETFELDPNDFEEQYCEMLDSEGTVDVWGMKFDPSRILKELDPTAFNCGLGDYVDSLDNDASKEYKDIQERLEEAEQEKDEAEEKVTELRKEYDNLKEQLYDLMEEIDFDELIENLECEYDID